MELQPGHPQWTRNARGTGVVVTEVGIACVHCPEHHETVTQPAPEYDEAHFAYEAWRDLQDVLEERDAEWWAEQHDDQDDDEI